MASSSAAHRRHRLTEDAIVGQFVIGGEIGKGSFAQVFLGKHKVSGATVAVKSVELARLNKKLKENLYGEIKILKTLRHPHIVALHDCVESATHINLVMEYCELGDLSMFIKRREKLVTSPFTHDMARKYPSAPNSGLNEVVTRHFLKQLASALKFLREGHFVHRDVKPQNLLLLPSPDYRDAHKSSRPILTASQDSLIPVAGLRSLPMLKLADFGFARVLPSTTLAETLCGSPLYMAPEILRYERYDAKADLWSVGTVLYEMVCGRPPFRASNHVELLRKIEAAQDQIRFPRETIVSAEVKGLIRALLKRNPVERLSFENFFNHEVITGPIPGLVEDDIPRAERPPRTLERVPERVSERAPEHRPSSREHRAVTAPNVLSTHRAVEAAPSAAPPTTATATTTAMPTAAAAGGTARRSSFRRYTPTPDTAPESNQEAALAAAAAGTIGSSPRNTHDVGEGTAGAGGSSSRRPSAQPSSTAPGRPPMYDERRQQHRLSSASLKQQPNQDAKTGRASGPSDDQDKTAQDIAFERDYVLVEKKHVEVNAFADEMAASPRLAPGGGAAGGVLASPPKPGQTMVRRATQQGHPTSATGAVPAAPSRAMQVAQGALSRPYHGGDRAGSLSGSPNSTTSFIAKAIHDASFRLLGVKNPVALIGKGASPPQLYNPFPAYPTPSGPSAAAALITDGRHGSLGSGGGGGDGGSGAGGGPGASDGDARVAQLIEDYATRSDVVYGFAEVKYKQLVPLAPSAEHDLSGLPAAERPTPGSDEDDELTLDAVVVVSEEALVLYVKALSLLAKSMDIANMWWRSKLRSDAVVVRESPLGLRVNAAVQWIRSRFNEVLEKANFARERLLEAQRRLPEDHPSHPSNHNRDDGAAAGGGGAGIGIGVGTGTSAGTGTGTGAGTGTSMGSGGGGGSLGAAAGFGSGTDGVFLSAGVSAEKLMYDRAVEMSRAAAIGEISNDDLAGCELSYMTAICMLEAVLDTEDEPSRRRSSGSTRDEKQGARDEEGSDINVEDQKTVEFMIGMIKTRLAAVRKKAHLINSHSKAAQRQDLVRRRSGDVTPRSVRSHAS